MGGRVVVPRRPELARWRLRQRGRGEAGHPAGGGSRAGGRKGSHPTAAGAGRSGSLLGACIEKWLLELFVLLHRPRPAEAVGAVGIPGRWMVAGFPTVVGRSGRGWPVARSFPHPVSFHSLGGGKLCLPGRPVQACMRACVAACGLACRPACGSAEPRAELRAGLREPRADLRAALDGRDCAAPPPLRPLRSSSLANGEDEEAERNRRTPGESRCRLSPRRMPS